jgi:hypothetical protein
MAPVLEEEFVAEEALYKDTLGVAAAAACRG